VKARTNTEFASRFTIKLHGSMAALRSAARSFRLGRHQEISRVTPTDGNPAAGKPTRRAKQLLPENLCRK
jgi:hypothetical protein